jgi:putative ABC transport system ATP-binding protein
MNLIEVADLAKDYVLGDTVVHALDGVTITIGAGEFVAVMGPSGSGKSTFMNLIGCLDRPSRGAYRLARTSALENVELPLMYAGLAAAERHRRAAASLAQVGLAERGGHLPSQLSGGQQQRVAIARALVNDPALILADEPTGALDSRTSLEIMALLQQLNRDGITIVVVTHEHDIADYAGRLITFRDGRVRSDERQDPRDAAADLAARDAAPQGAAA